MEIRSWFSGNVTTRNGSGHGQVTAAIRKVMSDKSWHEFDVGFGNGLNLGTKYYRKLPGRSFLNMSGNNDIIDQKNVSEVVRL